MRPLVRNVTKRKVHKIEFGTNPVTHATQEHSFHIISIEQALIFSKGALIMPLSRGFTLFEKNRSRSVNKKNSSDNLGCWEVGRTGPKGWTGPTVSNWDASWIGPNWTGPNWAEIRTSTGLDRRRRIGPCRWARAELLDACGLGRWAHERAGCYGFPFIQLKEKKKRGEEGGG
ncbi:hypothetical protein CRG98_009361 [Punica granatum]|uniref:Uncharacterized protein n=1 Tax=Punica granatum TaxID=22663 RepID=A0A2I0KP65_PUNGR|nr:hypothetical protein CRG98_009361 [Punica granatum]